MAEYGASNIKVLKGLEAVRKRPGMYIGDTSTKGLHHLVYEVVDNSIDEAMAGFCDTIKVTLTKEGSAIVEDNGRGIPVGIHEGEGISAATVVMTVLHAGGKFDKDTYKVSGGLHGVGVSVVNALSKDLHLTVYKDGEIHEQDFKTGIPVEPLKVIGKTKKHGTKVEFFPDDSIFSEGIIFDRETLIKRFKELCYLNPKISIEFKDERDGTKESFHFEGGLKQFVEDMNTKEPLSSPQFFQGKLDDIEVDIALMYADSDNEKVIFFTNNIKNSGGGTHEAGFRAGLTRSMSSYISKNANAKERGTKITGEDCKEGLIAIVSVRVPEPQFNNQAKEKLVSSYVRPLVQKAFSEKFNKYLEENPIEAKAIMGQILLAARGRDAAKRAKDLVKRKDSMSIGTLPGKLADCQSKDPVASEIYLVEGDSAGGCWSGDTKVKCANGEDIEIAILAEEHKKGKVNFIYTYNHETDKIELQKIKNAWQTKITDDLLYITLDNGKRELCTSDHKWLLRDGKYMEAKDLKVGNSIMPIYTELQKFGTHYTKHNKKLKIHKYEVVLHPNGQKSFTHHLADKWNLQYKIYEQRNEKAIHRHHIDKNPLNNNPTNIEQLTAGEHVLKHSEDFDKQTPEYKAYMSKKMKEQSEEISQRVKADWDNPEYRAKFEGQHKRMRELQIANGQMNTEHFAEYWANETHRAEQSQRVTKHFQENPDAVEHNRKKANEQWDNKELREWRAEETRKQMSNPENVKRKLASERETRIKNSLAFLNQIGIDNYENQRKETKNRKVFTIPTLISKMEESENYSNISNREELVHSDLYAYNHKIVKIEKYEGEPIPVYDIEVPNTHNFALSSGVFVHNSAKQGRDRVFQAILPLKGKILNVEKARLEKILKSDEIKNMITALGCGIGDEFNEEKLRYHKVIIMTDADVDGCLKGDTKVKLLDGTYETMEELSKRYPSAKDKFWVWASDKEGNPVPAKAHSARVTKEVTKLYKITLDNDFVIEATDNHPFRLLDGTYCRADELIEGTSLMPIYHKIEKGGFYPNYELMKIGKKWIPTHKYVNKWKNPQSDTSEYVTHHIDHNRTNNTPENLTLLTRSEHSKLHGKDSHLINNYNGSEQQSEDLKKNWEDGVYENRKSFFIKYNKSEEHSQSVSNNNRENWKNSEYRESMIEKRKEYLSNPKVIEEHSQRCETQWKNDDIAFRMQMTRVVNVAKKAIEEFGELSEESYQSAKPKTGVPNWSTVFNKYEFDSVDEFKDYVTTYNHKIKSIEVIEVPTTPVYDLTVDKYHNFAIEAGEDSSIFVHNSHIQTLLMTFFFRFLKPIIEKGYLYLAQPPLYRYKKGKNETYLKDDKALNDFLIEHGIGVLESESMGTQDLTELFKLVAYYRSSLLEIEKRFALPEVVRYMIENPDVISTDNVELAKHLEEYINNLGYNILNKTINEEMIQLFVQTNDGLEELIVDDNLFTSPHYVEATYLNDKIKDRITDEFKDRDILEMLEAINSSAKKGAYIQRYKGLGEMNPEQLWETTMNPEDRRLLQVVIDDDETASETFILFMGDEVEPRRAYIETHAKDVKHLDV